MMSTDKNKTDECRDFLTFVVVKWHGIAAHAQD